MSHKNSKIRVGISCGDPNGIGLEALANALVDEAKALNNDATRLRNAGDNRGARAKNSEAKRKIDAAIASIEAPSVWHEEAELEEWAMPAEYVTLGHLYGRISKLQKRIRMGGGK